jgi:hypothetical protein
MVKAKTQSTEADTSAAILAESAGYDFINEIPIRRGNKANVYGSLVMGTYLEAQHSPR